MIHTRSLYALKSFSFSSILIHASFSSIEQEPLRQIDTQKFMPQWYSVVNITSVTSRSHNRQTQLAPEYITA